MNLSKKTRQLETDDGSAAELDFREQRVICRPLYGIGGSDTDSYNRVLGHFAHSGFNRSGSLCRGASAMFVKMYPIGLLHCLKNSYKPKYVLERAAW